MKTSIHLPTNSLHLPLFSLVLLVLALALPRHSLGATRIWSGGGADDNWSTVGNWGTTPVTADDIIFGDTDATGTSGPAGTVNNIVNSAYTAVPRSLWYTNTLGFHTTRIDAPRLTLQGTTTTNILQVGTGHDGGADQTVYATILGESLTISNRTGFLGVRQTSTTDGLHRATLDLSGLNTFNAILAGVAIGRATEGSSGLQFNKPQGTMFLAKTNTITSLGDFVVGHANNNPNANTYVETWLGQENTFYISTAFRTGFRKSSAMLAFQPGLTNPRLKLRGTNDTARLPFWSVADNGSGDTGTNHKATNYLTGGILDVLVDALYVGKTYTGDGLTGTGLSQGGFFFDRGLIDANSVEIGFHSNNNNGRAQATMGVFGTAELKVNNDLRIARKLGGNIVEGALNVEGGKVSVAGNITDGGGTSTLTITNGTVDLKPAGDTTPGLISVDTLNWDSGTLTNYGGLFATDVNLGPSIAGFSFGDGMQLGAGSKGVVATMNLNGGTQLSLSNAVLSFDFADINTGMSDMIMLSSALKVAGTNKLEVNPVSGSLPAMSYTLFMYPFGQFTGSTNNFAVVGPALNSRRTFGFNDSGSTIDLVVSGAEPVALTWSGDGAANLWNTKGAANWNGQTEKFYNWDTVTFDDTGSAAAPVQLVGDLYPNAIDFNNTSKNYVLSGSGRLTGSVAINKAGTGSLQILTTNDNTGAFNLNAGTLIVGDGATADGGLGTNVIANEGTVIFNAAATQYVAGAISGSGAVVKAGPGLTVLPQPSSYAGITVITNGVLRALSNTSFGTTNTPTPAEIIVTNGGTLDLAEVSAGLKPILVSGDGFGGQGAIVDSSPYKTSSFISQARDVSLVGETTFGGTDRWDIRAAVLGDPGLRANGYKLTKISSNTVAIVSGSGNSWNTGLGDVEIKAGSLAFEQRLSLGDPTKTITIRSNATLQLYDNKSDNPVSKIIAMDHPSTINFAGPSTGTTGTNIFVGTINTSGTNNINESNPTRTWVQGLITGPGAVQKGGNGVIWFTGANTYTGWTLVSAGTFALGTTGSMNNSAGINVSSGAILDVSEKPATFSLGSAQTLSGAGVVTGSVAMASTAILRPGATLGTLSFSNNLTMAGTTYMEINKGNANTNDRIAVAGSLTWGGRLEVTNVGAALAVGDKFTLFNKVGAGAFTDVVLPAGYVWTNKLTTDASIEVIGLSTPTTPTNITFSVSGSTLTLQWPGDYLGWTAQSNSVNVADPAAWYDIPGSAANTNLVITVDPATPKVFYRLRYMVP